MARTAERIKRLICPETEGPLQTIKYEEVYLKAYETGSEARSSIGKYIEFYNSARPHSSLDARTPDSAYFSVAAEGVADHRAERSLIGAGSPV